MKGIQIASEMKKLQHPLLLFSGVRISRVVDSGSSEIPKSFASNSMARKDPVIKRNTEMSSITKSDKYSDNDLQQIIVDELELATWREQL